MYTEILLSTNIFSNIKFPEIHLTSTQVIIVVVFCIYLFITFLLVSSTFLRGNSVFYLTKGFHTILERREQEGTLDDIADLAAETENYFIHYMKLNPSSIKTYDSINSWLDDLLMQTNLMPKKWKKKEISFSNYYHVIKALQADFEKNNPFYQCSNQQKRILTDIQSLETQENHLEVDNILSLTKAEFIQQSTEIKKNEKTNLISLVIGVAGILVSVLLTVFQSIG